MCLTVSDDAVTKTWYTSSTLVACTMFTLNLNLSSPAAAPGLLSCGAPPGTSVLPLNTCGSILSLWKIQTKEITEQHYTDRLMKLQMDTDT